MFVIINPESGKVSPEKLKHRIKTIANQHEVETEIHILHTFRELGDVINKIPVEEYRSIVVAGGDGTIARTVSYLQGKNIPLGIIPVGTGNLMAKILRLPLATDKAITVALTQSHTKAIDALKVEDRIYFLQVSIGFTAHAIQYATRERKSVFGIFAYLFGAIKYITRISRHTFILKLDGATKKLRASEVIVANTGAVLHPRYQLLPNVTIDDGVADVFAVKQTRLEIVMKILLKAILFFKQRDEDIESFGTATEILVTTHRAIPVQADGDIISNTPVKITVIPEAAHFIVPKPGSGP